MNELYEKLIKLRDENNRNLSKHEIFKNVENDILKQLFGIAFSNTLEPDTLPKVFTIQCVKFTQADFESFMKRIGFDVTVTYVYVNFGSFNFEVTQK